MPDGETIPVTTRTRKDHLRTLAAIGILCLAAILFRLTSFVPAVVDTDEGLYMVQAREWLNGGWPLVAAWDMHPIGAPAMFAVAFLLFGVSVEAARLLGLICVFATSCGLYAAARAVGAPRRVGVGAGLLYSAQSVLLGGLCTNTELLIAPFVTGAVAIGLRAAARAMAPEPAAPGWWAVIGMGALIGPALVVKQVVVPEGCFAFALLVLPALLRGVLPWSRVIAYAAAYAALCVAPFLLAGFAYWLNGWLDHYIDGSLMAPFRYSLERIPGPEALRRIGAAALLLGFPFIAAIIAVLAWRPRFLPEPLPLLTGIAVMWFAVASAAIAGPGFYFAHYFLLWLPPLSLLAAVGAWWVALFIARRGVARATYGAVIGLMALQVWLIEAQSRLERGPGLMHPDPVREVSAAVARIAGPGGDAFIANYHPSVYVIAGVRVATRFPFPPHLTGVFEDLSDTSTETELLRVLAARPRVIVVDRGWMHTMRPAAAELVMRTVAEAYELAATANEYRGPVEIYRAR